MNFFIFQDIKIIALICSGYRLIICVTKYPKVFLSNRLFVTINTMYDRRSMYLVYNISRYNNTV